MDALEEYLFNDQKYLHYLRMKKMDLLTFQEVEDYLYDYCYSRPDAKRVVSWVKSETEQPDAT
jgi:hypothetical protein